jgi:integrase
MAKPPELKDILRGLQEEDPAYKVIYHPDGRMELETDGTDRDHKNAVSYTETIGPMWKEAFVQRLAASPPSKGVTLADAMADYSTMEAKSLKPDTWDARSRAFRSFVAHMGPKTRVEGITRAQASKWTMALIEGGTDKRTVANYCSHVAQLFEFLKRSGQFDEPNPVKGLVVMKLREKRQRRAQGIGWEAFDLAQLKAIYDPANLARKRADHVRWCALMGLYSGARVGELAQLYIRDFVEEDGIWCLKLVTESDGQSQKTESSRRLVPLHPDLEKIGLREYVDSRRKGGHDRLFDVKLDGRAGVGAAVSSGFSYYITAQLGLKPRRAQATIGFHSLRSTVIQALQASRLPEERRRALVGHEGTDSHSAVYMRPWTPLELSELWTGLKWGEWLDFAGLRALLVNSKPGR